MSLQVGDELCLNDREFYGVVLNVAPLTIRFREYGPYPIGAHIDDVAFDHIPTREECLQLCRARRGGVWVHDGAGHFHRRGNVST